MFADSGESRELNLDEEIGEVVTIPWSDSDADINGNTGRPVDNDIDKEEYDNLIELPNPNNSDQAEAEGDTEIVPEVSEEYIQELSDTIRVLKTESRTLLNKSRLVNNADALQYSIAAFSQANDLVEKLDTNPSTVTATELEGIIDKVRQYMQAVRDLIG